MNNQIFVENCRSEFNFLKNPDNVSNLLASHIQIKNGGFLLPLSLAHLENEEIVSNLWMVNAVGVVLNCINHLCCFAKLIQRGSISAICS